MSEDGFTINVTYLNDEIVLRQLALGDGFPGILMEPRVEGDDTAVDLTIGGGLDSTQVVGLLFAIALTLDEEASLELIREALEESKLQLRERQE